MKYEHKIYEINNCCVFRKTKELFGGLSNMASGFPLRVNRIYILTSEALYQACRFPHLPDVQKMIINEKSPMSAKMVGKPYRYNSRPDWDNTKIKIMRWCLKVKLAQNFFEFGKILESTDNRPIVEDSFKDDFWGAIRDKGNDNILKGVNALGRLLMELRQFYYDNRYSYDMFVIEPLDIPDFKLYGNTIETIDEREIFIAKLKKSIRYDEIEKYKTWVPENIDINENELESSLVKETNEKISEKEKKFEKKTKTAKKTKAKKKDKSEGQAKLQF